MTLETAGSPSDTMDRRHRGGIRPRTRIGMLVAAAMSLVLVGTSRGSVAIA